jgi:outer membrane protein OmpA-like peptidoglycan-associated protein
MVADKMNDVTGGLFFDDFTSFQVGFTYHFKHSEAKKMAVAPAPIVKIKEVIKHDTVVVKEAPTPITKKVTKEFAKSVFFQIGVSKITDYNQKQIIEEAANFLKTYPEAKIQIDGYADKATGTKQVNMKLSQNRAQNIANELTKTYGIDASRITADGHGTIPQIYQTDPKNRVATLKATAEINETSY